MAVFTNSVQKSGAEKSSNRPFCEIFLRIHHTCAFISIYGKECHKKSCGMFFLSIAATLLEESLKTGIFLYSHFFV